MKTIEGTLLPVRIGLVLALLAIISGRPLSATGCSPVGKQQITFQCNYVAAPRSASEALTDARIVLNRALLSCFYSDHYYEMVRQVLTMKTIPNQLRELFCRC
jgi:hypothetical protein